MIPVPVHTKLHRGFSIGSTVALGTTTLNLLADLLERKPQKQIRLLEGRATVRIITLGETGSVVVKTCLRGDGFLDLTCINMFGGVKQEPKGNLNFFSMPAMPGYKPLPPWHISPGERHCTRHG